MTIQELYSKIESLPQRKTFRCTDTELAKYANQPFSVAHYFIEPDDQHDVDCLPMMIITFNDGTCAEAFFDECYDFSHEEVHMFYQNLQKYLAQKYL